MHPSSTPRAGAAVALLFLLVSCRTAKPVVTGPGPIAGAAPTTVHAIASTKATVKLSTAWSKCHELFSVGTGDVTTEVARLAQGCALVTQMHRVGETFKGQQSAAEKPQTYRWKARSGHCYRAYGVGVPAIKNLDLLVTDSNGIALGQDGSDDGAPVVLDTGAVCFKQDDEPSVVVSVGDGSGGYAVEVWED